MRTQKRHHKNNKSYTVFRLGNMAICTRLPYLHRYKKKNKTHGGNSDNEYLQTELFQNLVSVLRSGDADAKGVHDYLESQKTTADKEGLMKFIFKKQSDRSFDKFFDTVKTRKLKMQDATTAGTPENTLYVLLSNKVNAQKEIARIKGEIAAIPGMDDATKVAAVNTLENGASMSVASVSANTMNALRKGSHALAGFFAPDAQDRKNRRNENDVEILFFDQTHKHYRKGDSMPEIPDDEKRYGDFMIINRPTKYADTSQFVSDMTGSVEDVLANIATSGENILCADNSPKCQKYTTKRKPYMKRITHIVNNQPQADADNI